MSVRVPQILGMTGTCAEVLVKKPQELPGARAGRCGAGFPQSRAFELTLRERITPETAIIIEIGSMRNPVRDSGPQFVPDNGYAILKVVI